MSSKVKTATPFINRELLLKALDAVGCRYTIQGGDIHTERRDYYGAQKFVLQNNGRYAFVYEDSWRNSSNSFLADVEKKYNYFYAEAERRRLAAIAEIERLRREQLAEQERLRLIAIAEEERREAEEEKQRLERERREFVEKQRAGIIAKAKEEGYDIEEKMVDNKIKIVLRQTSY